MTDPFPYEVLRWPFEITAANRVLEFWDSTVSVSSSQNLPLGIFIHQGNTGAISPDDIIQHIETAIEAARVALGKGGSWAVTLSSTGHVEFDRTGGTALDDLWIDWTATNSLQSLYLGFDNGSSTYRLRGNDTSPFQGFGQWLPGFDADYDSGESEHQVAAEHRNVRGRPSRVVHGVTPFLERLLTWSRVYGARMKDYRADDAGYATVAGISTGEDNTYEGLLAYLLGAAGPYGDHRVYLYLSNDPSTTPDRDGPYEVILEESKPGLSGIEDGDFNANEASETYPVSIKLWREGP